MHLGSKHQGMLKQARWIGFENQKQAHSLSFPSVTVITQKKYHS
jgi:hypothetical protein